MIRDTDLILFDRNLRRRLCEGSTDPELLDLLLASEELPTFGSEADVGCVLYEPEDPSQTQIEVRVKGYADVKLASVLRVTFGLARINRNTHLSKDDVVMSICGHHGEARSGRGACLNPSHARPSTFEEINAVRCARTRLRRSGVAIVPPPVNYQRESNQ